MKKDFPEIRCDVLIIGGGSAGAMAAIRAKEMNPEQEVVIFEKGDVTYSGCIARGMDALNIVAVPGISTPELYVEASRMACEDILDEPPSYRMAQRSWDMLKKLEGWNVCFPVDDQGRYEVLQVHPKGKFCVTMQEPELKTILARRLKELNVRVLNRTMGLELLTAEGRVAGAVGINVRTGEIIACAAKAVILTAGGTARFGLPNNGYLYGVYDYPGNTGDGYCLAYRAGAELSGFEYTLIYYIVKDINAPLLYITLTRGAKLLNAFGFDKSREHPSIKSMLVDHHREGSGPMRIIMSHLPEERIRAIEEILFTTERPVQERFYAGRGVDFRTGEIELWPTECFLCGGHGLTGVRVDANAASTVPGLFAAGDTALVARGHLTGAFVFGEIAAESATRHAEGLRTADYDVAQVRKALQDRNARLAQASHPIPVEEFEYKVRRIINDYCVPPKNAYKLDRALWWMERFRQELTGNVRVGDVHDLFKSYEIENIIQCADLSARASKARQESRWGMWHFRTDFPKRNDADWVKHIVLSRGPEPRDVNISFRDVIRLQEDAP